MPSSSQLSGPTASRDVNVGTEHGSAILPCTRAVWYLSKAEIEQSSPSRKDGIDAAKEDELRKSYCAFLRELGIKMKMPHVVIATSTVFCHQFFAHQSHHKNDRYTIATACMFLAGKVEEARRSLEDVVAASYCLQNKNSPLAVLDIKEKELYERQKELVIVAEQVVLVTLDFNLKVRHPYNFLVVAASKYKSAPEALLRVACIIVNDVLYTSLCLQFRPQHIAAGALLLAAKLLKFNFPSRGWWREFNVTFHQLKEVTSQVLELYEQERVPFSVVQSSSSSSSIDVKTAILPDTLAVTPDSMKYWNIATQPHHSDNDAALLSSSCGIKKDKHLNALALVGRPPVSMSTGPKLGPKEFTKPASKNYDSKPSDFEVLTKRKRLDDDSFFPGSINLQHSKPSVVSRKGKGN